MSLFRFARPTLLWQPLARRTFATNPPSNDSVVSSLKPQLMAAMRAKDKPRLTVLRSLLAEITNASKTNKPISNDAVLFSLLSKQIKASQAAVDEFVNAKREDLVEKERSQLLVLEGYLNQIDSVKEEEVKQIVEGILAKNSEAKPSYVVGTVMKTLAGRPVDATMVTRLAEAMVAQKP